MFANSHIVASMLPPKKLETKKPFQLSLLPSLVARLDALARGNGVSRSVYLAHVVEEYLRGLEQIPSTQCEGALDREVAS